MPDLDLLPRLAALQQSIAVLRARGDAQTQHLLDQFSVDLHAVTADVQTVLKTASQAEERYSALFYNRHLVMLLIDPDTGRIVDANPAACTYYGYSREELTARYITDLNTLPPDQVHAQMEATRQVQQNLFQFQHRLATGEVRDVEVRSGEITLDDRPLLYSIIHDVTDRRRAEEDLPRNEQKYRRLFNSAHVGIFRSSIAEGRILEANLKLAQMFGYERPEDMLATFLSVTHYVNPTDRIRLLAELKDDGSYTTFEVPFLRRDGSRLWAIMEVRKDAAAQCIEGVMLDITAHRLTADALIDSEVRNRSIVEALAEGVLLQHRTGEVIFANESAARILGLPREQLVGRDELDPRMRITYLDGSPVPIEAQPAMVTLRTGRPVREMRVRVLKPDHTQVWLSVNAEPLFHADNTEPYAAVTSFVDVTDRVQVETHQHQINEELEQRVAERTAALRKSEERLRLVLDATRDGLWDWDLPTNTIFSSPRLIEMLGFTAAEFDPSVNYWPQLIHPEDAPRLQAAMSDLLSGRSTMLDIEHRMHTPGGNWWWSHTRGKVVAQDAAGQAVRFVGMMTDISDRKAAENRLRALLAAIPDVMFVNRLDGLYVDYHASDHDLLAMPPEQFLGKHPTEVLPPDLATLAMAQFNQVVQTGEPLTYTYPMTMKHETRQFEARLVKCGSDQVLTIVRDITDRQQAEMRLRALLAAIPDMMFLNNAAGIYLDYYAPQDDHLVAPPSAFLGKHMRDVLPADLSETFQASIERVVQTGESITHDYQLVIQGQLRHFEARMVKCGATEVLSVVRDVTDRIQGEAALRQSEANYRLLAENTTDMIGRLTPNGICRYASPASRFILGLEPADLIDKSVWQYIHPNDQGWLSEVLGGSSFIRRDTITVAYRAVRPDGREVWHETVISPLLDPASHEVMELVVNVRDITERKRAEEARRQSEENYRNLFENASVGIFHSSPEGWFLRVNPALALMLGYASPDELMSSITDIGTQLYIDTDKRANLLEATLQREGWVYAENHYRRKDGSEMIGSLAVRRVLNPDSTVAYLEGFIEDITERRHVEEALRNNQELFALFMQHSPIYAFIKESSPTVSRVIQSSENFVDMIGIPGHVMVGKTMAELFPPEVAAKFTADDWAVVSSGKVLKLDENLNGRHYTTIKFPIIQGGKTLLAGYTIDITERQRAEEALRESETRYRTLFEAANDAIFIHQVRPDGFPGNILAVNSVACEWLGYTREELLRTPVEMYDTQENPDEALRATGQLRTMNHATFERLCVARDGHRFPVEINARRLELNGAQVYMSIMRDITQRKQAEAALQQALQRERELNQMKTQFVSMVSHEFRTPLTAIQSTSDLLKHYGQRFSEEKKQSYLERMQAAIKRMTTMLDEMLILGRAESGKLDFNPAPIDLEWFCRTLTDEVQLSSDVEHSIVFSIDGDGHEVCLDENLLRHILTNLLSNAIKYSPPGDTITLAVTCSRQQTTFQVIDHGIGIPPDEQARLFETFYRASNVGSIQGTGLGLAIVKRSVDLHHGTITFSSEPDHGSTFVVTLPSASAA